MIYRNVELYNVQELVEGGVHDVLSPEVYRRFQAMGTWYTKRARGDRGLWLCRLPDALRRQLNPNAQVMALATAACEIRLNLHSEAAAFTLGNGWSWPPAVLDVYQGAFLVNRHALGPEPVRIEIALPPNMAELRRLTAERRLPYDADLTRVVLPYCASTRLLNMEGDLALPEPHQVPARRLLFYGSSITHGYCAQGPMDSYAQLTAMSLGMDPINLGLGGAAHLEPEMADYIAGRGDWDVAVLEMGINILGAISTEEFARRVDGFVTRIARAHPDKWVFCIDLFTCAHDLAGTAKIATFRQIVRQQVAKLALPRLVYVCGEALLTSASGLTADLVHPSPAGMAEIAHRLVQVIVSATGTSPASQE